MLREFEAATQGMKIGESKTFPLVFPEDYQGKDVAGKTADFMVTVKKLEAAHLPEVDDAMAKSLGIAEGTVEAMRADIRKNLQREVKFRLLSRNKQAAMDALVARADFDLPRSSVMSEVDRMVANAREELKQRGIKDADKAPIPQDMFLAQAERRVRLGLTVAELVRTHSLEAKPEHIKQHVDELASSYEKPAEVVHWYYSDRQRMAEVESVVIENNVTDYILSQVKVEEKHIDFDELMGQV
jgi:trigger factor